MRALTVGGNPRNRSAPARSRARDIGVQERMTQKGHEYLQTIAIPTTAVFGQSLYTLEVNPMNIPRLQVIASQYKQWKGEISLNVEALGNAFATSSVTVAFVPDPDFSDLPTSADLVRVVESSPSKVSLHLKDDLTVRSRASWALSTSPWKFLSDSDPSDRSNGIFVIVAQGSPGTIPVDLKLSVNYNVVFQGNSFVAMEPSTPTATTAWYGVNNALSDILFAGTTGWVAAGPILTLNYPAGTVSTKYQGSWVPSPSLAQVLVSTNTNTVGSFRYINSLTSFTVTATQAVFTYGSALPALVAATAYTFVQLPRSSAQV